MSGHCSNKGMILLHDTLLKKQMKANVGNLWFRGTHLFFDVLLLVVKGIILGKVDEKTDTTLVAALKI